MAGVRFTVQASGVVTGTAERCVLQIVAAANHRVRVPEFGISFDGVVDTDVPILVQLFRQTDTPTGSESVTPVKMNSSDDETIQTTATKHFDGSDQPTKSPTDPIFSEYVHPQGGYTWQAPFGNEIVVPGGTRLGMVVTAGVSVNCAPRFVCDE